MSLDKFGRSSQLKRRHHQQQQQFAGASLLLSITQDGNINVGGLRLCNVKYPTKEEDAATKAYADDIQNAIYHKVNEDFNEQTDLITKLDDEIAKLREDMKYIVEHGLKLDKIEGLLATLKETQNDMNYGILRQLRELEAQINNMTPATKI